MALFENFPYTNFHEMNLDWILQKMVQLSNKVDEIASGKIQIADPIQWDITKQYPAFTVVMDGGNAYLSMQPVPYGTDIGNTDYWQQIFNIEDIFDTMKGAITASDDGNSTVASENRVTGDLVWLNDVLYRVTQDIAMGDPYTGQNTEPATMEEITQELSQAIQDAKDDLQDEIDDIVADFDNTVLNRLEGQKIAIYGDSWCTDNWGAPWFARLQTLSKAAEIHHVGLGSATLGQIYASCWDGHLADIYVIMGGLNDVGLNTGATDFMTAITNFVAAIRTVNSTAEIYFVTPPKIDRNDFLKKRLPPDFYRTCFWRLAPIHKFHVINGLKWCDLVFADGVHPTPASAPVIGDYLYYSLLNHGDEETHLNESCTCGRQSSDIMFSMIGGTPYLSMQNTVFSPIASDGSSGIVLDIGRDLNYNQATCYVKPDNNVRQPCMLVMGVFAGNSQIIMSCPTIAGTGATSATVYQNYTMMLPMNEWNAPVTA